MSLLTILGIGGFAMAIDYLVKGDEDDKNADINDDLDLIDKKEVPKVSSDEIKEIIEGVSIKHGERQMEIPNYKNYKHHIFSKRDENKVGGGSGTSRGGSGTSREGSGTSRGGSGTSGGGEDDNNDNEDLLAESENDRQQLQNKQYSDNARELKAIVTDVVVHNYVATQENIFRFMKFVVGTFDEALDLYAKRKGFKKSDFLFLYKGGNVMRLLANEFLIELPGSASREINDYYKGFFKRSDADFAIYINPSLPQYETVFAEVTYISFLLQDKIRLQFMQNPTYFFEYEKYNDQTQKSILVGLLDSLNKSEAIKNVDNEDYYGAKFISVNHRGLTVCRDEENNIKEETDCPASDLESGKNDSFVEFTDKNEKGEQDTVTYNTSDDTNYIYVQSNTALQFADMTDFYRHFNLTRTKINFNVTYLDKKGKSQSRSLGGELIDVSLGHRTSTGVEHFWEHQKDLSREYTLKFNDETITFHAYSIEYIVQDLEDVIYRQSDRPWKDKKYQKRVNRTFYFYFLDLFDKIPSNLQRIEILAELYVSLRNKKIDSLDRLYDEAKDKNLLMKELIKEYMRLYKESNTEKEFEEYTQILLKNLEVIINAFKQTAEFCSVKGKGKFDEENLYHANIESLAGGGGGRGGSRSKHSSRSSSRSSSKTKCNCRKCRKCRK